MSDSDQSADVAAPAASPSPDVPASPGNKPTASDVDQADSPPPAPASDPATPSDAAPQDASAAGSAGAETPPVLGADAPGDAPPPLSIDAAGAAKQETILIETPTQGAAVIQGAEIPGADAEPVVVTPRIDPLQETSSSADPPAPPVEKVPEHPQLVMQRLRTKLAAYGEEALKAIQPEIEQLIAHLPGLPGPG